MKPLANMASSMTPEPDILTGSVVEGSDVASSDWNWKRKGNINHLNASPTLGSLEYTFYQTHSIIFGRMQTCLSFLSVHYMKAERILERRKSGANRKSRELREDGWQRRGTGRRQHKCIKPTSDNGCYEGSQGGSGWKERDMTVGEKCVKDTKKVKGEGKLSREKMHCENSFKKRSRHNR